MKNLLIGALLALSPTFAQAQGSTVTQLEDTLAKLGEAHDNLAEDLRAAERKADPRRQAKAFNEARKSAVKVRDQAAAANKILSRAEAQQKSPADQLKTFRRRLDGLGEKISQLDGYIQADLNHALPECNNGVTQQWADVIVMIKRWRDHVSQTCKRDRDKPDLPQPEVELDVTPEKWNRAHKDFLRLYGVENPDDPAAGSPYSSLAAQHLGLDGEAYQNGRYRPLLTALRYFRDHLRKVGRIDAKGEDGRYLQYLRDAMDCFQRDVDRLVIGQRLLFRVSAFRWAVDSKLNKEQDPARSHSLKAISESAKALDADLSARLTEEWPIKISVPQKKTDKKGRETDEYIVKAPLESDASGPSWHQVLGGFTDRLASLEQQLKGP